jgi:acyl carrier protein
MLNQDSVLEDLIGFVTKNFMVDREEIELDDSLIDQGIIDSFGLVEITAFIQKNHGITVAEEEMTREQFGSMNKMAKYITQKANRQEDVPV